MRISELIEIIRVKEGLKTENEVAQLLQLSKSSLSSYKRRNTLPYEALLRFCDENGKSLDELLGLKTAGAGTSGQEEKYLKQQVEDLNKTISLQQEMLKMQQRVDEMTNQKLSEVVEENERLKAKLSEYEDSTKTNVS